MGSGEGSERDDRLRAFGACVLCAMRAGLLW